MLWLSLFIVHKKEDPNHVHITVGSNLINYPYELTTCTTDMVSSKLCWNSTISMKGARFAGANIKNIYLDTTLNWYESMKMPLSLVPQDIIKHYGLFNKVLNGHVYIEIHKGVYGLLQAGILANKLLKNHLSKHRYYEQPHTSGLWRHESCQIWFNLVVEYFGIKYIGKDNLQHLYDALWKEIYDIVEDRTNKLYYGVESTWNGNTKMDTSTFPCPNTSWNKSLVMPTSHLTNHSNVPSCPTPSHMEKTIKYLRLPMTVLSLMMPVRKTSNKLLVVTFTMQGPLIWQYSWHYRTSPLNKPLPLRTPRNKTNNSDYMWTHPDAKICYPTSDMILNAYSNASYLSAPCARSHAGGYFFLGTLTIDDNPIKLNVTIHITCTILKLFSTSTTKAELGALFPNAQEAKVLWLILNKLGHPQPPTPIHINNTTTVGILNNTIKQQPSRVMEMRYFWLLDGKAHKYFKFYHQTGQENLGD